MEKAYIKDSLDGIIPGFIKRISSVYPLYIGGGVIRSIITKDKINDIDIFIKDGGNPIIILKSFISNGYLRGITHNGIYIEVDGYRYNLILKRFYSDLEDLINSFDYGCVMSGYDINSGDVLLGERFIIDNLRKEITFNIKSSSPISSLLRLKKYFKYGYNISHSEVTIMLLSCLKLKINDYDDLKEHINGVYGFDIMEIVNNDRDFSIDNVIDDIRAYNYNNEVFDESDKVIEAYELGFKLISRYKDTKNAYVKVFGNLEPPIRKYRFLVIGGDLYTYNEGVGCNINGEISSNEYVYLYREVSIGVNGKYYINNREINIGENVIYENGGIKLYTLDGLHKVGIGNNIIGKFKVRINNIYEVYNNEVGNTSVKVNEFELDSILKLGFNLDYPYERFNLPF